MPKTKTAILETLSYMHKMEPGYHARYESVQRVMGNAGCHRRKGVFHTALKELESEGRVVIIKRGHATEGWDLHLPEFKAGFLNKPQGGPLGT